MEGLTAKQKKNLRKKLQRKRRKEQNGTTALNTGLNSKLDQSKVEQSDNEEQEQ